MQPARGALPRSAVRVGSGRGGAAIFLIRLVVVHPTA